MARSCAQSHKVLPGTHVLRVLAREHTGPLPVELVTQEQEQQDQGQSHESDERDHQHCGHLASVGLGRSGRNDPASTLHC